MSRNPVYLREKGGWGKPNPFYETVRRYSPFVVIGAIFFGLCAGWSNPALFAANNDLAVFYCFLCLPGILLTGLTMFGSFMAPALTAPSISMEVDKGTWEMLRVTPLSARSIVLAKLFGGLSRLRILWPTLFAVSLLQGVIWVCSLTMMGGRLALFGAALGVSATVRPWLEVLFAGIAGMVASTRVKSATMALVATYTAVVLMKLINSSLLWYGVSSLFDWQETGLVVSTVGPTAVYGIAVLGLFWSLIKLADGVGLEQ
ncbi:MAG: ABC transporter permease [Anaerolineae bacterium]